MSSYSSRVSTGWESLDQIIDDLRRGDNVVWQVDRIDDYQRCVSLFVNNALANNEKLVYMRFGRHTPLLEDRANIKVYDLKTGDGFEAFSTQVHSIITKEGRDTFYVFDSLSDLLHAWATDLMIGDFFSITCPYLFELNTIAYFCVLRNRHSYKSIARIRETTQLLLDMYNYKGKICIHPIKVQHRYSPTMFFPHIKKKEKLLPVINSAEASQLFSHLARDREAGANRRLDYWDHLFLKAGELLASKQTPAQEKQDMVEQLSRLMLSRDKKIISLVRQYFSLEDFLRIKERLIGTGFIGGKSVGMLLARKIVSSEPGADLSSVLEHHDSFFVGSDVFYSYIVQNGWWKLFMAHKTREGYLEKALEIKNKMLGGEFPEEIKEQFWRMLEYFGQSPIIVRSSSLLEDAFGSAFSGKYESFFCVNQGTPEKRYENFVDAVKKVFASTMGEDALAYRLQRGLDQNDEQMALLVQRVSGAYRKHYFFPEFAGVGLSHNPFVWKEGMDPQAGMLRLVMGLGTRAVNRVENDYPRIVAIDEPLVRPLSKAGDIKRFSQKFVDVLNLEENTLQPMPLSVLVEKSLSTRMDLAGVRDLDAEDNLRALGRASGQIWTLTFDNLLTQTPVPKLLSKMLQTLEKHYGKPVDIEFTINMGENEDIQINLLQCRPFQTLGQSPDAPMPDNLEPAKILIRTKGAFMGGNAAINIDRIIFVDPKAYTELAPAERYSVARLVGTLNKMLAGREKMPVLLLGPGRWGTHTPAMGVPVTFSEINNIAAIGEISYQDGSLIPDLSFGTHFFQDLVETKIFYMAIYPESQDVIFNADWLCKQPNLLGKLCPDYSRFEEVLKVVDTGEKGLTIRSSILTQQMICHFQAAEVW
jgi:hypothetical protein